MEPSRRSWRAMTSPTATWRRRGRRPTSARAGNPAAVSFLAIFGGILQGLDVTLGVTLYGLCFAVPFALGAGIAQQLLTGWGRAPVTAVIEFWRSTPILVLMFTFYYALPVTGIYLSAATVAAMT